MRGDVFVHAPADDGAPVCFSCLLLTGSVTTYDKSAVTCPVCLRELARPHRGEVRMDDEPESVADLEAARAVQQGDFEDREFDAAVSS